MTADTTDRYLIGYRVNDDEDENICLKCHASNPVPFTGTVSRDREGYAYLIDGDGEFELQECVSCQTCDDILAPGAILISETPREQLQGYLTGEEWQNLTVLDVAGELYVTINKAHYMALGVAANALQGSLEAYGDYQVTDRTSMMTGERELVSVTFQVRPN